MYIIILFLIFHINAADASIKYNIFNNLLNSRRAHLITCCDCNEFMVCDKATSRQS